MVITSVEECFLYLQADPSREVPRADMHLHTNWTDGENSVRQMYTAAVRTGLRAVLFSEHARKSSADWFGRFCNEVRALPQEPCRAFVGIETRVSDFEGGLDLTDEMADMADMVMASVHRFPDSADGVKAFEETDPREAVDIEYRLAMAALDNPRVHILGHPFGMCARRYGVEPDEVRVTALIEKSASRKTAFEINSHYHADPYN